MTRKFAAALLFAALTASAPALAQSSPGWGFGKVPTPAEWNAAFASKQDLTNACALCANIHQPNLFTAPQTITTANQAGLVLRSGALGSYISLDVGRTEHEGQFGVAAGPDQFVTGSVAGDLTIQSLNNLMLGSTQLGKKVKIASPVTITTAPGTFDQALNTVQVGQDTSEVITGPLQYNWLIVTHRAHVTAPLLSFDAWGNWNDSAYGFRFGLDIGGANASGQFIAGGAFQIREVTPYTGPSAYFDRVGLLGEVYSTVNNPLGAAGIYAMDAAALLDLSGHSDQVVGLGSDVGVASTATALTRVAVRANSNVVPSHTATTTASVFDAAFGITNGSNDSSAFKHVIGLQGAPFPGIPLATDASWFWAQSPWTVASFADLANMTFTGKILNFQHATLDGPTGALTLGTVTSPTAALLTINNTASALPATSSVLAQLADVPGTPTTIQLETFGTFVGSQFIGRLARGTPSVPTAVQADDILTVLGGNGYGVGGYSLANAQIRFVANQTFTGSAQGTRIGFYVTANGSTGVSLTNAGAIENDGGLTWPRTVTGGSKGAGAINVSGGYYVNGILQTSCGGTCAATNATNTFTARQVVSLNATTPTPQAETVLQLVQSDAVTNRLEIDSFAAPSILTAVRANGTAASPTTLVADDQILALNAWGFDGTSRTGPAASFRSYAGGTWSSTSHPTYLDLATTPPGSTTLTTRVRIDPNGRVAFGPTAPQATNAPYFDLNQNTSSAVVIANDINLRIVSVDGGLTRVQAESYGGTGNSISGYSAGGTKASPSASSTGMSMLTFSGYGFTNAPYLAAYMLVKPNQNFTATAGGSLIAWATTQNDTVVLAERMRLQDTGCLSVGLTTACPVGVVSVLTGFRVNGAAASGNVLRGDGTNFVSSTIAIGDLTGFGANVAAALAVAIGSAGSPVVNGGALGTPASGVATNLTGTASGLTAGNVTTNANLTGDVTSIGNATTLTNAPVIAKVLTGYASGAGTVSASDSILSAIQKLNGNDALKAPLAGPTFTGTVTLATLAATTINGFTVAGTIAGGGNQINNVVIGASTPLAGSFTTLASGVQTLTVLPAANTSADGLVLTDTTAASSGNQQYSPRIRLTGAGWKSDATAGSQVTDWTVETKPLLGTSNAQSQLAFSGQVNGAGYAQIISFQYNPTLNTLLNINSPTGSPYVVFQQNLVNKWYLYSQTGTDVLSLNNSDANGNVTRLSLTQAGTLSVPTLTAATSVAAPLVTVNGGLPVYLAFYLPSANFNSTSDQAIAIALPTGYTRYRLANVFVSNPSVSLTTAAGGIYTAASKGGIAVVAAATTYSSLTTNTTGTSGSMASLTIVNSATAFYNSATLYLSLTTPQGSAATADVAILIQALP